MSSGGEPELLYEQFRMVEAEPDGILWPFLKVNYYFGLVEIVGKKCFL